MKKYILATVALLAVTGLADAQFRGFGYGGFGRGFGGYGFNRFGYSRFTSYSPVLPYQSTFAIRACYPQQVQQLTYAPAPCYQPVQQLSYAAPAPVEQSYSAPAPVEQSYAAPAAYQQSYAYAAPQYQAAFASYLSACAGYGYNRRFGSFAYQNGFLRGLAPTAFFQRYANRGFFRGYFANTGLLPRSIFGRTALLGVRVAARAVGVGLGRPFRFARAGVGFRVAPRAVRPAVRRRR